MILLSRNFTWCLSIITALYLLTACAGISEKKLTLDPVFAETEKINTAVSLKRSEFTQLKNEYALTQQAINLDRMSELVRIVSGELERAEYFQQNYKYYRKGLDYERWKSAGNTYRLCRKTLCEMMLDTGKLQMQHADREENAAALFNAVVSEFEDEEFSGYVAQAKDYLQRIEKARLYAASKNPVSQEVH